MKCPFCDSGIVKLWYPRTYEIEMYEFIGRATCLDCGLKWTFKIHPLKNEPCFTLLSLQHGTADSQKSDLKISVKA